MLSKKDRKLPATDVAEFGCIECTGDPSPAQLARATPEGEREAYREDEIRTQLSKCEFQKFSAPGGRRIDWRVTEVVRDLLAIITRLRGQLQDPKPIPMRLRCPSCGDLHIDVGEFATKVHHTHACQKCGEVWRPAIVATVGVRFLPGFQDKEGL